MLGDKKLLACIACHNPATRIDILKHTIKVLNEYEMPIHIIVDVNTINNNTRNDIDADVTIHSLKHPYQLTWIHREHMVNLIDDFDYFMYLEDDMGVPFDAFKNYIENFKLLWPDYIPSFVRIEDKDGQQYITDCTEKQSKLKIFRYKGKEWINLTNPYHAFWIMPQKELKQVMTSRFNRLETWREYAASYPMWELSKKPLVEIKDGQISPLYYSYHITNNYATNKHNPFAKIKINELIQ